ncbi:MAG: NAD-dependent epimerase/dehydratase family protein, partial [Acidaminococcus sp.]|nr:NAD-dependent epimerase/dehydratase family protein [Acidaminococcus sp.]
MRKILVTGGAGFIGSHVVPALLAKGDCEVVVLDNLSTGRRNHVPEGARFQLMDMRSRELWDFLAREKFQTVVHLAAQTLVPYSMEHPEADEDLNVTGIVHVLEGCRKTGVEQFIFSSSAAIYGDNQNLPLKETEVPAPT